MNWPILISALSLLIAVLTFYLTNLRRPSVGCQIGPTVQMYHGDHAIGGSTGFYLPVTFENTSARTGIVTNAALICYRRDQPEQQFFMTWKDFANLDPDTTGWRPDEIAHAIAVPGRSTIAKIIWFMWFADTTPKLYFREGAYILDFCYWTQVSKKPRHERHEVFVTDETAKALEERRSTNSNTSRILWLDKQIDYNRVLTRHESEALLGS